MLHIMGKAYIDVIGQNRTDLTSVAQNLLCNVTSTGQEPSINHEQQSKLRIREVSSTKEAGTSNICTKADQVRGKNATRKPTI
jgi:hypothetical protein